MTTPTTPETPDPLVPPETPAVPAHLNPVVFATYLARTRWFAGKGRPHTVSGIRVLGEVPGRVEDGPWAVIHLVDVVYTDVAAGSHDAHETYQVPLALYTDAQTRLDHAFLGWWEDPERGWVHAYDAVHDRWAMDLWLRAFDTAVVTDQLSFQRVSQHALDLESHSTLFSGEQSNSSVAYGDDALLKVFRKVTPGPNPDITVHRLLTQSGSEHVAALYGWLEGPTEDGVSLDLAMLQQFLRTASDGWDLALSSVRGLFADPELSPEASGGDFAGESARLGEALRDVHAVLATSFGTGHTEAGVLAEQMRTRLAAAREAVPELAPYAAGLGAVHDALAGLGSLDVQHVHGDLHLGQTLRTAVGWKIVDFEGEPAKTLAERLLPDSRWRDVAGMLRSFDYAPRVVEADRGHGDDDLERAQLSDRAEQWAERNRAAFLLAYAGGPLGADEQTLLDAYVADKAVYETVYEARNRPTWVTIPLAAVARIGAR
ncbi:MAG: hypothetical protein LH468_11630 [Nocardioides sp.]|nr:hypothetical protein [Nocardioides sp.]